MYHSIGETSRKAADDKSLDRDHGYMATGLLENIVKRHFVVTAMLFKEIPESYERNLTNKDICSKALF